MNRRIAYIVLASLLAASCTEKINLPLDSTYTRVVVDGNIQADTGTYSVALTTSADYFSNVPVPRIVNAAVTITDGANTVNLHESQPGISGIYQTDHGFRGEIGKTYTLHVSLEKAIAGVTAVEASSALLPVAHIDSIAAYFDGTIGKSGIWFIKLWAQDPPNVNNYYMFNLYRNGILLTDTITKKGISSDKFFNGSYINGVPVMRINNSHKWETISPGDTITLQMSGITKEYFDFVEELDRSGFSIPLFTGPPANIRGTRKRYPAYPRSLTTTSPG
ncbi:MAG: DUF4249 domain-containing protein, partial [Bacteroidota bacterium]